MIGMFAKDRNIINHSGRYIVHRSQNASLENDWFTVFIVWAGVYIHVSNPSMKSLDSFQGSILKQVLGFNKRSHHSCILHALNISPIEEVIHYNTRSLLHRVALVQFPFR